MELLKQLNAIRDATNRSLLMNNNRTDSENVPNTIPPRTPSGAGDDVSDDEERTCEKEEEENENEEEKKMRRRPFKYAKAISQMMMRKGGGKGGAGTDDDGNVDGDDKEATTRITCASQNGVACAFGFANGDLLVADAETGERVALFKRESSEDDDDDDGDDKNNENNNNNNNNNNSITCISFDATGTFLCSSSANGTVRVRHVVVVDDDDDEDDDDDDDDDGAPKTPKLINAKKKKKVIRVHDDVDGETLAVTHKSSVNCCVIDPNFASRRNRFVMFGGRQSSELVLHCFANTKNASQMTKAKTIVLQKNDGPIRAVAWRHNVLAWASNAGVRLRDATAPVGLARWEKPPGSKARFSQRDPVFAWNDKTVTTEGSAELMLAWADAVVVFRIRQSSNGGGTGNGTNSTTENSNSKNNNAGGSKNAAAALIESIARSTSSSGGGNNKNTITTGLLRSGTPPLKSDNTVKRVEICATFQTPYLVCGIAPYASKKLVLLAWWPPREEDDNDNDEVEKKSVSLSNVELRIADWRDEASWIDALPLTTSSSGSDVVFGPVISPNAVSMSHYQPTDSTSSSFSTSSASNLKSISLLSKQHEYLVASSEVVLIAKQRSAQDTVFDALRRQKDNDDDSALDICEKYEHLGELRKGAALAVAEASVTRAFDAQNYALAAKRCPRALGRNPEKWRFWAKKFASVNKLGDLAFYVPVTSGSSDADGEAPLKRSTYELILMATLSDPETQPTFLALVKTWPAKCVDVGALTREVRLKAARVRRMISAQSIDGFLDDEHHYHRRRQGSKEDSIQEVASTSSMNNFEESSVMPYSTMIGETQSILDEALAELYVMDGKVDRALEAYLSNGRPPTISALDFIDRRNLGGSVPIDKIGELFVADAVKAAKVFAACECKSNDFYHHHHHHLGDMSEKQLAAEDAIIPDSIVLSELDRCDEFTDESERRDAQLKYLEALCDLDPDRYHMHHEAVCRLTAQRNPKELLSRLVKSARFIPDQLPLELSRREKKDIFDAQTKKFFSGNLNDPNETYCYVPDAYAHALARNGRVLEALDVIVTELGDISGACELVNAVTAECTDEEKKLFWRKIIELAQKSDKEAALLSSSSTSSSSSSFALLLQRKSSEKKKKPPILFNAELIENAPIGVTIDKSLKKNLVKIVSETRRESEKWSKMRGKVAKEKMETTRLRVECGTRASPRDGVRFVVKPKEKKKKKQKRPNAAAVAAAPN